MDTTDLQLFWSLWQISIKWHIRYKQRSRFLCRHLTSIFSCRSSHFLCSINNSWSIVCHRRSRRRHLGRESLPGETHFHVSPPPLLLTSAAASPQISLPRNRVTSSPFHSNSPSNNSAGNRDLAESHGILNRLQIITLATLSPSLIMWFRFHVHAPPPPVSARLTAWETFCRAPHVDGNTNKRLFQFHLSTSNDRRITILIPKK